VRAFLAVIVLLLGAAVSAQAQSYYRLGDPPRYSHVGNGAADEETEERTFAACKLQADVAAPMICCDWSSLINWLIARDDCMRAYGWARY
jgi:hypothetical protein